MPDLKASRSGLELIKRFEGFTAEPEALAHGGWLIGFGQVRDGDVPDRISRKEAEKDLREKELPEVEALIRRSVLTELNQNEFDALVSFAFSLGEAAFQSSEVLRLLNSGQRLAAASAIEDWVEADLQGQRQRVEILVRRRAAEKALFLKPAGAGPSLSSAQHRPLSRSASGAPAAEAARPVPEHPKPEPRDREAALEDVRERLVRIVGPDGSRTVPASEPDGKTSAEAIKKAVSDLARATSQPGARKPSELSAPDILIDDFDSPDISEQDAQRAIDANHRIASRPLAWMSPDLVGLGVLTGLGFTAVLAGIIWGIFVKRAGDMTSGSLSAYLPGMLYIVGGLACVMAVFNLTARWQLMRAARN